MTCRRPRNRVDAAASTTQAARSVAAFKAVNATQVAASPAQVAHRTTTWRYLTIAQGQGVSGLALPKESGASI